MTRRRFDNRGLTPEEDALWRKAMRDVAAYGRKRPLTEKLVSGSQPAGATASKPAPGLLRPRQAAGSAPPRHAEPLATRTQHPFLAGDPRLDRLAGRGRLPIDAVIDLHGHSQKTAEAALKRFVVDRHANGARCLLVITGKGAPEVSGPSHGGHRRGWVGPSWSAPGGKGVLKARLHDWLADETLRRLVSRASPAHQRHGGGGAFYLFLKK